MRTPFVAYTTKFDVVIRVGEGRVSGVSHGSHPKGAEFVFPSFGSTTVLLYICLHPLTQNDQIRHGNTYGEGRVLRRLATPLHLHKSVLRIVSDS